MIEITDKLSIKESEIELSFVHASGPGGQHVNKVATAVQLRFDVHNSPSLPQDVRQRLVELAGNRITRDGVLIIDARRFRTQDQNREDAISRLVELISQAVQKPKRRRRTRLTSASKERRLEKKRRRSEIKRLRRRVPPSRE